MAFARCCCPTVEVSEQLLAVSVPITPIKNPVEHRKDERRGRNREEASISE
jgi:hypothetical protein